MVDSNGNQRVTNAIIAEQLKHLSEQLDKYHGEACKRSDSAEARIRLLEEIARDNKTRIELHDKVHDRIDIDITGLQNDVDGIKKENRILLFVGNAIAAAIGIFVGKP